MKNMTRLLRKTAALLLVATLLASLTGLQAFAASAKKKAAKKPLTYTVMGDSIANGYGLWRNADNTDWTHPKGDYVKGAYPELVAEALGVDRQHLNLLCRSGFTTTEYLRLLDDTYESEMSTEALLISNCFLGILTTMGWSDPTYTDFKNAYCPMFEEMRKTAKQQVADADIITINLGSNDTSSYSSMKLVVKNYLDENGKVKPASESGSSTDFSGITDALKQLKKTGKLGQTLGGLLSNGLSLAVSNQYILDGYKQFVSNWDRLIKTVRKLNPTAKIYVVSMYNPFAYVKLTDESMVNIGHMMDMPIGLINGYTSTLATTRSEYCYVDVMGTPTHKWEPLSSEDFQKDYVTNVHPNFKGHKYMAKRILSYAKTYDNAGDAVSAKVDSGRSYIRTNLQSFLA